VIRHIASPNESLEQPVLGDDTSHSLFIITDPCGAGKKRRRTTIEILPEETLLEIFDFYRLEIQSWKSPWKWHRLAHVCRKWRHVISTSPRRLDMRILCKYGAPIGSTLRSWPTLPLVVRFDSDARRKSKHLPRNVVVALRRPDRLCEINLDVKNSMTGSIVEVVQKPCRALESIRIRVKDAKGPSIVVRNAFLGGSSPHLREIELDGITFPFPEIRQVLLSTDNLVDLHLSNIPNEVYFSPEDLVTGLSTLVQLEQLMVGFHSPNSRSPPTMTRLPLRRTTLPSLQSLEFHGATEYLEEFVARIDLPALSTIRIMLFNDILFEIPQFCKFIPRLNTLQSPTSAIVILNSKFVEVRFIHKTSLGNDDYSFQNSCIPLDWKLSFLTQITSQLSPLLSSLHELVITGDSSLEVPTVEEGVDSTQWLELFQQFNHVTKVTVSNERSVPCIVQALVMDDIAAGVLPGLSTLRLNGYNLTPSVAKAAEQFVATRRDLGHTVNLKIL
jgi:F-box-like